MVGLFQKREDTRRRAGSKACGGKEEAGESGRQAASSPCPAGAELVLGLGEKVSVILQAAWSP